MPEAEIKISPRLFHAHFSAGAHAAKGTFMITAKAEKEETDHDENDRQQPRAEVNGRVLQKGSGSEIRYSGALIQ